MKFIVRQILIIFTLVLIIHESKAERKVQKFRLSRVLENIIEMNNEHSEGKIESLLDMDCVKNFFKLPPNSKMVVKEPEDMVLTVAVGMKCSNKDKFFDIILRKFTHERIGRQLTCLKWHLKQHEPSSKLIENFEVNDNEVKKCKENRMYMEIEELKKDFENMLGPLNVYTCGAVSENGGNDFITFVSKGAIIEYGNITEELKKSEKEKLKEYLKDVSIRTVNCNIKRFKDDPQAFNVNNTLNHYYKKELEPIDPEEEDKQDYNKRLIKLEETIDYDCVKEKLNLPENGDKPLIEVEATILIASAKSKCIEVDPFEFSNLFIDLAIENGQRSDSYLACVKSSLQEREPTSKLAVTSSSEELHKYNCRYQYFSLHLYGILRWSYVDSVGKLNETTCGVVNDEFVDVIALKTLLLFNEKDKVLKIIETWKLFNVLTEKLHKLADCILERIK